MTEPECARRASSSDHGVRARMVGVQRVLRRPRRIRPSRAEMSLVRRAIDGSRSADAGRSRGGEMTESFVEGAAGGSARREYERRRTRDEQRARDGWGPFAGLAVALTPDRPTTRATSSVAAGEDGVGVELDRIASRSIRVLHDRRIPGSRAGIDHVAVTTRAVWVIDAKRYSGRPELKIEGGLLRPRVESLLVGRRDTTSLVDGLQRQMDAVRAVAGEVPVLGALCFVDADWPLLGGSFRIRGIEVLWPGRLAELLCSDAGSLDTGAIAAEISGRFRAA